LLCIVIEKGKGNYDKVYPGRLKRSFLKMVRSISADLAGSSNANGGEWKWSARIMDGESKNVD